MTHTETEIQLKDRIKEMQSLIKEYIKIIEELKIENLKLQELIK